MPHCIIMVSCQPLEKSSLSKIMLNNFGKISHVTNINLFWKIHFPWFLKNENSFWEPCKLLQKVHIFPISGKAFLNCLQCMKLRAEIMWLNNTFYNTFGSVQSLSCAWLFVTPWTAACHASLSITNSWSLLKLVHWVGDTIQPSHPLSSPSPPAFTVSQN